MPRLPWGPAHLKTLSFKATVPANTSLELTMLIIEYFGIIVLWSQFHMNYFTWIIFHISKFIFKQMVSCGTKEDWPLVYRLMAARLDPN